METTATGVLEAEEWQQDGDEVTAHYSSISLHRKCPQAWYYRYDLGLSQPRTDPTPHPEFGSWWGALRAADSLERGRALGSLMKEQKDFRAVDGLEKFNAATVTVAEVMEAATAWYEKLPHEAHDLWHEKLGDSLPNRLKDSDVRWHDQWGKQVAKEHPLGVEVFWKRELPRPESDKEWDQQAHLLRMILLGYIDELYYDPERGVIVARDWKSGSRMSTQSAVDDMMDSQLQLYAWGANPMLQRQGLGQVRAVAYDRINSVKPTTPQLTLGGSLSKSVTNFDLRTYLEWSAEDTRPKNEEEILEILPREKWDALLPEQRQYIMDLPAGRVWGKIGEFLASGPRKGEPKFGVYEPEASVIEKISTPAWRTGFWQRTLVPVSPHIVRAHLRAAVDTTTDIWRTQQRAARQGEAARNLSKDNCKWCDYVTLCRAQMFGGPQGQYELAEHNLTARDGRKEIGLEAVPA